MLVRSLRPHRLPSLLAVGVGLLACVLVLAPLALAVHGHGPRARGAVIGGAPAPPGAYPSAAFVLDVQGKRTFACSGTVIAPSLVLTAGHCAKDVLTGVPDRSRGYRVLTSQVDLAAASQTQISKVVGVIPYPGWARRRGDVGDAGLLVLEKPVTAQPMPLIKLGQAQLASAGTRATIAGWGLTSIASKQPSKSLRFAHTVVQPASWCKRHVRPFFPKWELCTVDSAHFSSGGCYGDSGGPLMVPGPIEGEMVEVGIVALGNVRCSPRYPGVYTRVDALTGWLRSWISAYSTAVIRTPALTGPPIG
jgi:secreted trypsin-like serine protease